VGERGEGIELPHRLAGGFQRGGGPVDLLEEFLVETPLHRCDLLAAVVELRLEGSELGGGVPLPLGKGLLARPPVGGHPGKLRSGDLEVVAEDLVEADLEATDPGLLGLPGLEPAELLQGMILPSSHLPELGEGLHPQRAPGDRQGGWLGREGFAQPQEERDRRVDPVTDRAEQPGKLPLRESVQLLAQRPDPLEAPDEQGEVAGPSPTGQDPRRSPGKVSHPSQPLPEGAEEIGASVKVLDRVEPLLNRGPLGPRGAQPGLESTAARRRTGHVHHLEERGSGARSGVHWLGDLQVAQGLRVDAEPRPRPFEPGDTQEGEDAALAGADVGGHRSQGESGLRVELHERPPGRRQGRDRQGFGARADPHPGPVGAPESL
jgi:hypothetical protein